MASATTARTELTGLNLHADLQSRVRVERATGSGVIRGISIITEGRAEGHGFDVDRELVEQVAAAINGTLSDWTHHLTEDGLALHLGRYANGRVEQFRDEEGVLKHRALADFEFAASAHKIQPDGLAVGAAEYLMDRAEEDPKSLGISVLADFKERASGIGLNLVKLRRADFVSDPAANPTGLSAKRATTMGMKDKIKAGLQDLLEALDHEEGHEEQGDDKGEEGEGTGATARRLIGEAEDKGLTQEEIGAATDRSPGVIGAIKAGEIANPPDDFIDKIRDLIEKTPAPDKDAMAEHPEDEDEEEGMKKTAASRGNVALMRETLSEQKTQIKALQKQLAARDEREADAFVLSVKDKAIALHAPIDEERLGKVRALMAAGRHAEAKERSELLLELAEAKGSGPFQRGTPTALGKQDEDRAKQIENAKDRIVAGARLGKRNRS